MSAKRTSTSTMWDSVKVITAELIRKPVKEAVREALHEEAVSVKGGGETNVQSGETDIQSEQRAPPTQQTGQGGRSWLPMVGALIVLGGVVYLARRRMRSSSGTAWSEPSAGEVAADDSEGGYVSEGEMQTSETAGEESTGSSPSASDQ